MMMKNVSKSRNSFVYKYLTTDCIFGLVEGLPDRYISTTCGVRRSLITRSIKILFTIFVVILVACLLTYFLLMAPVIVLLVYCLYGVADTMCVTFIIPVMCYTIMTFVVLCATIYHLFTESESKPIVAVKDTYGFLKDRLCSKIDWVG